MKKLFKILSLFILLNTHASYSLPKCFNRTMAGRVAAGYVATVAACIYFMPSKKEQKFEINTFDPNNTKQYEQVLKLLTKEKEFLLDPKEDPKEVMHNYVQGMKTTPKRNDKNPCAGLVMKVMLNNNCDVVGFFTFTPDQYKINFRTIAVDQKYRGKGLATRLLQDLEFETKKKKLPHILCVVYSHNDAMLHLMKKRGYILYAQEKEPAFSKMNLKTRKITTVYSRTYVKEL